jgi:hypothetical protein
MDDLQPAFGGDGEAYEVRSRLVVRLLVGPFSSRILGGTAIVAVILLLAGGWLALAALLFFVLALWRASRLRLRVDRTGITVVNLFRTLRIPWADVRGVVSPEKGALFVGAIHIVRHGAPWRLVFVDATAALGKARRREIAARIADIGGAFGYGFAAGTEADLEDVQEAGLLDCRDPETHRAWRRGRQGNPLANRPS